MGPGYQYMQGQWAIPPQMNTFHAQMPNVLLNGRQVHPLLHDYVLGQATNCNSTPDAPTINSRWHANVSSDVRQHLIGKLFRAIFPSPDPAAMHDHRVHDLIQYAKKVEREFFEAADDMEEYLHLLAEKIYKIQKELQQKKQQRLNSDPAGIGAMPNEANGGHQEFNQLPSEIKKETEWPERENEIAQMKKEDPDEPYSMTLGNRPVKDEPLDPMSSEASNAAAGWKTPKKEKE